MKHPLLCHPFDTRVFFDLSALWQMLILKKVDLITNRMILWIMSSHSSSGLNPFWYFMKNDFYLTLTLRIVSRRHRSCPWETHRTYEPLNVKLWDPMWNGLYSKAVKARNLLSFHWARNFKKPRDRNFYFLSSCPCCWLNSEHPAHSLNQFCLKKTPSLYV